MSMDVRQGVILFADVVGSTKLYDEFGDRIAADQVTRCLNQLTQITQSHNGSLIKTIGDAVLCCFDDADMAIKAANRMQEATRSMRTPSNKNLEIRVGAHFGNYIENEDDIAGDVVNIAARLSAIAGPRRIIISEDIIERLDSHERVKTRAYDRVTLKGKTNENTLYEYLWEMTDVTTISIPIPVENMALHLLQIEYHNRRYSVSSTSNNFTIGRHNDCDITVDSHMSSRFHARIEYHRGKFLLVDESTNGTFVLTNNEELYIRRENLPLVGTGLISLGESTRHSKQLIRFQVLHQG